MGTKKLNNQTFFFLKKKKKKEKLTPNNNKKNVDINCNIREMKNSMARITQNRRTAFFSLWSFNQSEAAKKKEKKRMQTTHIS